MADLSTFPITRRWPAANPDILQLYSINSPNGVKVSIMLEEVGLPYEPHLVLITDNETWTPEFLSLNPNGKIPAIIDPNGPDGRPIALFESGAILTYLADKTGMLLPPSGARRYETLQWVFWQVGHIGPFFGQVGFFHKFAGRQWEDKRPLKRFADEFETAARRARSATAGPRLGNGRLFDRRHCLARLGPEPDRLLRSGRAGRLCIDDERSGLAGARACPPGRAARASDPSKD